MTDTAPPMIDYIVRPSGPLCGDIRVPGDKSISHRSIMFGAIADGRTCVRGLLEGEDVLATVEAFRSMGVTIEGPVDGEAVIHGVGRDGLRAPDAAIDLGNSGTSMRLLTGLLAGQQFDSTLAGDASLNRRPMRRVTEPLSLMGANVETHEGGTPPLVVRAAAGLSPVDYASPLASAQVKSCILLAGLYADGRTCVTEPAPTRDHTERMLSAFGVPVERAGPRTCIEGGPRLTGTHVDVPGDLSSAAFLFAAAAGRAGSDLLIRGVGVNPTRTGVLTILEQMGADIEWSNCRQAGGEPIADLRVRGAELRGIDVDPALVPLAIDEFPALFAAAATAKGVTRVTGAGELRVKESDRIAASAAALDALGVRIQASGDGMVVEGGAVAGGRIESAHDHRIAMAMAVVSAGAPVRIRDCRNVATSFPGFPALANSVGLDIEVVDAGA